MNILLIENEDLLAENIKIYFESQSGIVIQHKKSSVEALTCLEQGNYDVLITDLDLIDARGIGWLKKISRQRPDLKIIVISAHNQNDWIQDSDHFDVLGYFEKPFDINQLYQQIKKINNVVI